MRRNSAGLRRLLARYAALPDVVFLLLYHREPHAGQMAFKRQDQPENKPSRRALAQRLAEEDRLTLPILIDGMDDQARVLLSGLPNPAIVVDTSGKIVAKLPWAEPERIQQALDRVLKATPPASKAERAATPHRSSPQESNRPKADIE